MDPEDRFFEKLWKFPRSKLVGSMARVHVGTGEVVFGPGVIVRVVRHEPTHTHKVFAGLNSDTH